VSGAADRAAAPLPPTIEHARQALAERGPLAPGELAVALRADGFRLSEAVIRSLPDRWPGRFWVDDAGRLTVDPPTRRGTTASSDDADAPAADDVVDVEADGERWWQQPVHVEPLALDRVVVLDIETTGLDEDHDHVTQVGAEHLGTGERLFVEVAHPGGDAADAVDLGDALRRLDALLAQADAIAGHRVAAFDLPFLRAAARRAGIDWRCELPALDLLTLSVLVDPTLPGRRLTDLADHLDVPLETPHHAAADVAATATLFRRLLERCDPDDPSWALARACLARAGAPLARLLPAGEVPASLATALRPRPDDLVSVGDGVRHADATSAVARTLDTMRREVPGHRDRPSQRTMADAVAAVLDRGGQLAVEAPTGTGKSLAYLIPAAGRAARPDQPVVVATKTKLLQRQLRDEAERLRSLGMLRAPFRQVQGVGNYICTREVHDALEAGDLQGSEWVATAVAVRALATAPNGLWDDVTDGALVRSDLRYARQRWSLRATTSSCERAGCPNVDRCPLYLRLRGIDRNPGILSVNHAVVASWVQLTREGKKAPGDVLSEGSKVSLVFDEAHDLEDSLTAAWTDSVGALAVHGLIGSLWSRRGPIARARAAARRVGAEVDALRALDTLRAPLEDAARELDEAVAAYLHEYGGREGQVALQRGVMERRPEFRSMASAAVRLRSTLAQLQRHLRATAAALDAAARGGASDEEGSPRRLTTRAAFLARSAAADVEPVIELLGALRELPDSHLFVYVLASEDGDGREPGETWTFRRVPVEVGDRFADEVVARAHATVLTSATLTVGGSFDFIGRRLGIRIAEGAEPEGPDEFGSLRVPSPFAWDEQSMLVLTSHLPLPVPSTERAFCEDFASDQVGFLSLTGGRTLTLFAARSRMEAVAERVRRRQAELAERGIELLVQGEDSVARLTRQFRDHEGAVLYGLRSFWEGFDAPGETLSYLVIEKPPYPHPSDPLVAARQRAISDRGGDPFLDYVVPRTAITLAQGFGRLIRSETDRGAALIADRRVQAPGQANALLLSALPTSTRVDAADREEAWTAAIRWVTGADPDLSLAIDLPADDLAEVLDALRLVPGEDPVPKLAQAARQLFGIEELHPFQLDVMLALLEGRDVVGVAPTGAGKSLCFQLPALLHPEQRPFVVVSPLVALIKDQVDALRSQRGLRAVQGITGKTSSTERSEILRDLAAGKVRLLYVSPERLVRDPTLHGALASQDLGALVVDEAHCISSWGHDFRPEFRQVSTALLDMRRAPRLALTATATPEVARDIQVTLEMEDPLERREPVDRPDLRYWVRRVRSDADRTRELLRFVTFQGDRPGIVYASRRAVTEELAWILRHAGLTARAYHAELPPEQREAIQDDFLAGTTQVVVATKAFGMGINKPDIGWVVHYDLPESLEAYAQEAGRAARSPELTGDCVLFFHGGDVTRRRRQARARSIDEDADLARRLLAAIAAAPERAPDEHVLDPDELADRLGVEPEVLNVAVAWLERSGAVERRPDCTARGHVTIGRREPTDPDERRLYLRLFRDELGARVDTRKMVELDALATRVGVSPDELERRLIDWSLRRLVTFQSTRRLWRVRLRTATLPEQRFGEVVARWRDLERVRVDQMVDYAEATTCRRTLIAKAFGDDPADCVASGGLRCDVCDGGDPQWFAVPASRVPDPEDLVDVELTVLQAVAWASRRRASYSEANLIAALCGRETAAGGRPLPSGLLSCPQFGALRYVRANERRVGEAIAALLQQGYVGRGTAELQGRRYSTLTITDEGRARLGGRHV
jgi:ATP-dependent DNA helicase RecQ